MILQRTYSTEVLVSVGLSRRMDDVLMILCKGEAVFARVGGGLLLSKMEC